MKKVGVAVVAIAGLLFTSSVASAQYCAVGILAKAIYVSTREHRELTTKEAMSCGILSDDTAKPDTKSKKKRSARAVKKN